MKYLICFLPLILLFNVSCRKNKNGNCTYASSEYYSNGVKYSTTRYTYDAQGRITGFTIEQTPTNSSASYRYTTDSIFIDFGSYYTVFRLNSAGLATSSYMQPYTNPNKLILNDTYTYDGNGYLTQVRTVFSQEYLGSMLHDTSYTYYTIANGNLVKMVGTGTPEQQFTYSNQLADNRIPELKLYPMRYGPFMGKASVNLMATAKDASGTVIASYSYVMDKDNRLTEKVTTNSGTASQSKEVFNFTCDE